ncbi:tol-pal system protein YbgF [Rosistilla ulvae]|uniref:Tol-pal system protein YbgF n=1 Tax=Rosistilla ulvae TaxID=1930277 RepID=A0A517LUB6_9BACT|nr:tetratricopeptide repeat protein [Rosistilla ulvae]QDS86199.1 tol-pal system protein YbgF [Rosistilla ulvae]
MLNRVSRIGLLQSIRRHKTIGVGKLLLALLLVGVVAGNSQGQDPSESSEEALAVYADAANFQNNGAFDLAIAEWKKFLKTHAKDPLASKAAHYLGISQMRKESPDYMAASEAFKQALAAKDFELVEEALSNRGWCLFAAGQNDQANQAKRFSEALAVFDELLKKFPKTTFADQALFYSGEAAYASGKPAAAVGYYQRLIDLPKGKESPLYCDAIYANGVALEDQQLWKEALVAYGKLVTGCADSDLLPEVQIRQADINVRLEQFKEAAPLFRKVADSKTRLSDYALFRLAFCAVQLQDPDAAAKTYDELITDYPESQFASAALIAAGQSYYRAGKFDEAAAKFQAVLKLDDAVAATEAAHWLATIAAKNNKNDEVIAISRAAIAKGLDGFFAASVKMDLADALSKAPATSEEAIDLYVAVAKESAGQPVAARALYNAGFTALQNRDLASAGKFADQFMAEYSKDPLVPDVLYVAAEAQLQTGKPKEAAATYDRLLQLSKEHPSRSLWILRGATAAYLAEDYSAVVDRLTKAMGELKAPEQQAEAEFMIGSSYYKLDKKGEALKTLEKSRQTSSQWNQAADVLVTLGRVQLEAGKPELAEKSWLQVIAESPASGAGFQARYRLALLLSGKEDFDGAKKYYDEILAADNQTALKPYALYGSGWCQMKKEKYEEALVQLDQVLKEFKDHPVAKDAQLARGICLRKLGRDDQARSAFEDLLRRGPQGIELGHALYELALLEVGAKQPAKASVYLKRLVGDVPQYPDLDKVLYELAWAMRDQGDEAAAIQHFGQLVVKFPKTTLAAEASYHVGQQQFDMGNFKKAAGAFATAAEHTTDPALLEKAYYKLGWSGYQLGNYDGAKRSFEKQLKSAPDGPLKVDAMVMIAESMFKAGEFASALEGYRKARTIVLAEGKGAGAPDPEAQQLRELVFLHGGQCSQQLKKWDEALQWFDQMRDLFPSTAYLPQVFYETGYCYQQLNQYPKALQYYGQVAANYRDEVAARARFMMGEIHFSQRELTKAIPEFQRVMFGFGGEKAPVEIKNWQAKSAFEAGRCGELLIQSTAGEKRASAIEIAQGFYKYIAEKHPQHELVAKANERSGVLNRL